MDTSGVRFLAVEREFGGHPGEPSILFEKSRLPAGKGLLAPHAVASVARGAGGV
jgi:hypothetical protein